MSAFSRPAKWFYHEFGLAAINDTGRNAYIIILARALRMTAHGANSLILALFFAELHFTDSEIGVFMTLTLLGDVFLGGYLTLVADRFGRRRILIGGSLLMVTTGVVFACFDNFFILLIAAIVGVVSATGGDFGPFRAIEESMLSHLTTPKTRSDVLAWYVTLSTLGSAIGSEASGRVVHYLQGREGWSLADAYHALFWSYSAMGIVNAALSFMLTQECEIYETEKEYSRVPEEDEDRDQNIGSPTADGSAPLRQPKAPWYRRFWASLSGSLSQISAPTRTIMYKLWFLLAVDSLADGMVPYSLTNYYVDKKFHPAKSTLGDVTSAAYVLGAVGTVFAGPLARKIGLINTMVFTHIPSSASVLFFAVPQNFFLTVILLFVRAGLNNMDQAPRSAFIAGVVRAEERTAVMGITSIVRSLAAMTGPSVTGLLAGSQRFWVAFVAAGAFRLAYDLGLYALFINVKLHQHEEGTAVPQDSLASPRLTGDEQDMTELDDLEPEEGKKDLGTPTDSSRSSSDARLVPATLQGSQVRRRSPSPLPAQPAPPTK